MRSSFESMSNEILLENCNWLVDPNRLAASRQKLVARIRYRGELIECRIDKDKGLKIKDGRWLVAFAKPVVPAPGQSVVIYDGDTVVGGGIIT